MIEVLGVWVNGGCVGLTVEVLERVCLLRKTMDFFWMKSRLLNRFGVCLFPNTFFFYF